MTQSIEKKLAVFRKYSLITLIAVYFLILVGGIVRSTGSGMGCPDWPKCFGSWIPPTSEDELPEDYQEEYSMNRQEKNIRFASYLRKFGMDETATRILNDESIKVEDEFNAPKTWTEYINRLVGATIGILIFMTTLKSLPLWKNYRSLVLLSVATFVAIGFEGWLGSIVVSTKLLPGVVTTHMLLALIIVLMLTYMWFRSSERSFQFSANTLSLLLLANLFFLGIQVLLGTQVREGVDVVSGEAIATGTWISEIGTTFYVHRSFSILIAALNLIVGYRIVKDFNKGNSNFLLSRIVLVLIALEIGSGAIMAYFSIPAFFQPVHLLTGTLVFGLSFLLYLNISSPETKVSFSNA